MSLNYYLINQIKKYICKYHVLHHRETIEIMVEISCLKLIEVPSQLTNQINVRYVDAKSRYVSTLKLMALL